MKYSQGLGIMVFGVLVFGLKIWVLALDCAYQMSKNTVSKR